MMLLRHAGVSNVQQHSRHLFNLILPSINRQTMYCPANPRCWLDRLAGIDETEFKMIRTWSTLWLIGMCQTAFAFNYSYDFDGVLADNFEPISAVSDLSLTQQNGRLEFHTFDVSPVSQLTGYVQKTLHPTYDQSWTVSVDLHIPRIYDTIALQQVRIGLAAGFQFDPEQNSGDFASISMAVDASSAGANRYVIAEISDNSVAVINAPSPATAETITMGLDFNADTKVLTTRRGDQPILSHAISSALVDWGMTSGDSFEFFLLAMTDDQVISSAEPLTFDNFSAKLLVVPEPAAVVLLGCGSVLWLGWCRSRRRTLPAGEKGCATFWVSWRRSCIVASPSPAA